MDLAIKLTDYIRAAFSGLYVETFEPEEALREIQFLCHRENWKFAVWDIDRGLTLSQQDGDVPQATDPLAAIRSLSAMVSPNGTSLLVLKNFHRFLNSAEIAQALLNQLQAGKTARTFVIILAPFVQLPVELERQFVIVQHDLPNREQLHTIAQELLTDQSGDIPVGDQGELILDAAAGLTRQEAEGAFSLSLARHGDLRSEAIWEIKSQSLRKQNLLSLVRGDQTFAQLGAWMPSKIFAAGPCSQTSV